MLSPEVIIVIIGLRGLSAILIGTEIIIIISKIHFLHNVKLFLIVKTLGFVF